MAQSYTTNYLFAKFDRGDLGWDEGLNGNWDLLDQELKDQETATQTVANDLATHAGESNPHGAGISDLADVDLGTPAETGQVLKWNETAGRWEPGTIEPPESLSDLGDVDPTPPADGNVLVWIQAQGKYVPSSSGSGGATVLGGLTDVDLTTTPPTDAQALVFDADSGTWIPGTVQTVISSIGEITDVSIPESPSRVGGEVLIWNADTLKWEPGFPASLSAPPVQIQIGSGTVPAGGSLAVTFPQAFSGSPCVTLGSEGNGSPYIQAGSVSASGVTVENPHTADVTVHWTAIYGSTGGGGGTVLMGGGLPIDVGSEILTIPSMP